MSYENQPLTNPGVLNKVRTTQAQIQDRTRRFGYHGGTPMLAMDANKSGAPCNPLWGQRLIPFYPGKAGYLGSLNTLTGQRRTLHLDIMPSEYAYDVDKRFHLSSDHGFRILSMLTSLPYGIETINGQDEYTDEAYTYFDTVHPAIGNCPFGLFRDMQLSNPDVGASTLVWQPCPTCRLEHLKSDACAERIYAASSVLDSALLASLRDALIEANEATLEHVNQKSQMVQRDIAQKMTGSMPGRNVLNAVDYIHLSMMHKTVEKGNDQSQFARELAAAIREGAQPAQQAVNGVVISYEEAEMLAQYKKRQAQAAKMRESKEQKNGSADTKRDTSDN